MSESNPSVKSETIVSDHYKDDAGSRYYEHHQANPKSIGYRLNFDYFKPYLKPDDIVLDFGCGNGGMLLLLDEHVRKAEGLEVNPRAIEQARTLGLTVHAGLDQLPQRPVYDAVVSNHVLEHVRDVSTTLERLRGSMKPGGRLLLKLPLEDWRAREQRVWSKEDIDHHLHTWTPRLIGNVLYEAGFEVDEIRVVTSAWHPRLFPLLKWGLGRLAFRALAVLKKRRQLFVVGRVPGAAGA